MKVKKNLSIEQDVLAKGQGIADKMFSGNFSILVTYLINKFTDEQNKKKE